MNLAIVLPAAAVLLLVAVAGAAIPVRSKRLPPIESFGDPLEDRRTALLIELTDLETSKRMGALDPADYTRLRAETEQRMARVLRAMEQRRTGQPPTGDGQIREGRRSMLSWMAIAVAAAAVLGAIVGPSLARSLGARDSGTNLTAPTSISFFENRVQAHPGDVAARLDLAHRYLDAGQIRASYEQYAAALRLQPNNSEALANLGILLNVSGKPKRGLQFVDRALAVDPDNAEALFFKGVILLRGLDRPVPAILALKAFLRASPFGSEADQARGLLREARSASGKAR
jgi:cytochrome c-type biogenesis protein CcmH/NrfG